MTVGERIAAMTPIEILAFVAYDAMIRRDDTLSPPTARAHREFLALIESAREAETLLRGTDTGGRLAAAIERVTE